MHMSRPSWGPEHDSSSSCFVPEYEGYCFGRDSQLHKRKGSHSRKKYTVETYYRLAQYFSALTGTIRCLENSCTSSASIAETWNAGEKTVALLIDCGI